MRLTLPALGPLLLLILAACGPAAAAGSASVPDAPPPTAIDASEGHITTDCAVATADSRATDRRDGFGCRCDAADGSPDGVCDIAGLRD
jgi:hypothetical protein